MSCRPYSLGRLAQKQTNDQSNWTEQADSQS
jgi:hypothetical protein